MVIAVILLFGLCLSSPGQNMLSNLQFLEKEITATLDSLEYFRMHPRDSISIELDALQGDSYAVLNGILVRYCKDRGYEVRLDSAVRQIRIRAFAADFRYYESPARLLGFNRAIKREVRFNLTGWIEDHALQRIAQSINIDRIAQDEIRANDVPELEESPYSSTRGTWETRSVWTRYLEPAAVILSASTIIYLFFSMRSS
jgi:hypothetical protein